MKAMILTQLGGLQDNPTPLYLTDLPDPVPVDDEVLLQVSACGVCHTELDEIEGRTPPPRLPVVPGHQVVGRVVAAGRRHALSDRRPLGRGVDLLGLRRLPGLPGRRREPLPALSRHRPRRQRRLRRADAVPERFAYPIPAVFSDVEAAPLLCAGAIGYRSLRLTGLRNGQPLG